MTDPSQPSPPPLLPPLRPLFSGAQLDWSEDNVPRSKAYGDVYYSAHGGLAETRVNFLQACGLPGRWACARHFCVAELGFGTGLNFLATLEAWCQSEKLPAASLDFVSFEKHLMTPAEATKALANFPDLAPFSGALVSRWPLNMAGTQTLDFPQWNVRLILHIGDVTERLPESMFTADAWYLDGFSPAKNPDMWADDLYPLIAARSAPSARLGSFTVAGAVRRGLQKVGFKTAKMTGYGYKRHRLEAVYTPVNNVDNVRVRSAPSGLHSLPKVAILGAGIAGASIANRLSGKTALTVFDVASTYRRRASANPLALVMPRLDVGETPQARLCREAYVFACHNLIDHAGVDFVRAHYAPRDAKHAAKFDKLKRVRPLAETHMEWDADGLIFPKALLINPALLGESLLRDIPIDILDVAPTLDLAALTVNGEEFDAIVLAMGPHVTRYLKSDALGMKAGQVDWAPAPEGDKAFARNDGSYALGDGHIRLWGSSFERHHDVDAPPEICPEVGRTLAKKAGRLLDAEWLASQTSPHARASIRATTASHLPLVGALPRILLNDAEAQKVESSIAEDCSIAEGGAGWVDGVYLCTGMGSRGFGFASLSAEILTSEILGLAPPLAPHVRQAVSPMRLKPRSFE